MRNEGKHNRPFYGRTFLLARWFDKSGQSELSDFSAIIAGCSSNDADGNRVEKSNGSTGTIYWYMSPGIEAESDLSGNLKSEYVFFDGERVARKDFPGNSVFYYFSDHLKTASVITDSAGTIKEDEDYYPWGGEVQFVNNDSNHYKYGGHERDNETGLDYFGARYYGNWLGRFMSADWAAKPEAVPYADLQDPQSLNLYSYVRNIPTTKSDPDGHCEGDDCAAIQVTAEVTREPQMEAVRAGNTDTARVAGEVTYTFTYKNEALSNTQVHEDVKNTNYVNGTKQEGVPTKKGTIRLTRTARCQTSLVL